MFIFFIIYRFYLYFFLIINKRYVVVKFFDAEVIYDKETKFINATKLCQYISKIIEKKETIILLDWIKINKEFNKRYD